MSNDCVGPVLSVQCKDKEASLYLRDLARAVQKAKEVAGGSRVVVKDPCVAYEDQWVSPNGFVNEICGLQDARPSWKNVVYHSGQPIRVLLANGTITLKPPFCKCAACKKPGKKPQKPSPKNKTKKLIEISTVFVCSICDETFRKKKNYENHKKFAHLPPLVPRGQSRLDLSPSSSVLDYELPSTSVTNGSASSSKHGSSPVSHVKSSTTNLKSDARRKSEVRLTRISIPVIASSTDQDSGSDQLDSTSSPAPRKRARVVEVNSSDTDSSTELPAPKQDQRSKPVSPTTRANDNSSVASEKATPSASNKQPLMIAENAFSGCTNAELLAELAERKACFTCTCGIVYMDRALYYLHKSMHDQDDSKKCGFCGYVANDLYDFNCHYLDHRNPMKED